MDRLILAAVVVTLAACAAPKATTPMPKDDLTAIGTGASRGDSYDAAMSKAEDFCHRWRAAPSVVKKETVHQGELSEGAQEAAEAARTVAAMAGVFVPGDDDAYETTLIYRCY